MVTLANRAKMTTTAVGAGDTVSITSLTATMPTGSL